MKKGWIHVGIFGAALTILVFYYFYIHMEWKSNEIMNRAQIARMLALMRYSSDECSTILNDGIGETLPKDVVESEWYGKYVAVVTEKGWMKTKEDGLFHPGDALSYSDLIDIMEWFHISEENLSFSLKFYQLDGMVSKKHWCEVFGQIAVNYQKVQKVHRIIYGSPNNMQELQPWQIMTDEGVKNGEGISADMYMNQKVVVYEVDNEILCIIETVSDAVGEEYEEQKSIRVLLSEMNDDYEHDEVIVSSEDDFLIICGQDVWKYEGGNEVIFEMNDAIFGEDSIVIKPESKDGKIEILSIERSCGKPSYSGEIYLYKGQNGILIVNNVEIGDYVAGVVSSEVPMSYGMEALKAQAICARTYAMSALSKNYKDFPANVDDTVSSQVYNNRLASERSIQAQNETEGMVLKNEYGLTPTYFFSTSCGHTSAPEDVWYNGEDSEKSAVTVFLADGTVELDLSKEAEFRAFIDQEETVEYYEQDLPWFRWQVFIDDEDIEENAAKVCGENIGDLKRITITERAESGVLKAIHIEGDLAETNVYGEYRIRQIFSPVNAELKSQDGQVYSNWEMLPSGYFYMDELIENGKCSGYLLRGGGYGHGCGMSQNGAMKMAEIGKTYDEILKYFFADSEIVKE